MKYIAALFVASATLSSAQVVYNQTTGTFTCPSNAPNGAFCAAGDSQVTNIIIRCNDGVGHPGNCNDNLAGRPPFGLFYSTCYETGANVGDAACSKNCVVYPEDGSAPFTIPGCTPTYTSTTTLTSTSTAVSNSTSTTAYPNTTTTTVIPTTLVPSGTGIISPPVNGTTTTQPTKTPVGPTTTGPQPTQFTGAADKNSVGAMAGVLAFAALFMV